MFPEIGKQRASDFWREYRHRILHRASLSLEDKTFISKLGVEAPAIAVLQGSFQINPRKFAERVLAEIEKDFDVFAAARSREYPFSKDGGPDGPTGPR